LWTILNPARIEKVRSIKLGRRRNWTKQWLSGRRKEQRKCDGMQLSEMSTGRIGNWMNELWQQDLLCERCRQEGLKERMRQRYVLHGSNDSHVRRDYFDPMTLLEFPPW
jgi:hypothetical protein